MAGDPEVMIPAGASSFEDLYRVIAQKLRTRSTEVTQDRWQGRDVSKDPSARCRELMNLEISVPLRGIEDLDHWRREIKPNLPWADDHFLERVGGVPLNPGEQWKNWPWAKSADSFREGERFNHSYMERMWPKFARVDGDEPRRGINWAYGDLGDLVQLLCRDPYTRQAYLPLFFPEDTGYGDGGRKPCTLGYQFLYRSGELSIWYPMRSCDFIRHFQDDCYLAVRLALWVLGQCRKDPSGKVDWGLVRLGEYSMHITSLHVFENDWRLL